MGEKEATRNTWWRLPWSGRRTRPQSPKRRRRTLAAIVAVVHILGFLSSIDAVWSTRTPQGTIEWAVALNTFTYVAVPAY